MTHLRVVKLAKLHLSMNVQDVSALLCFSNGQFNPYLPGLVNHVFRVTTLHEFIVEM